MSVFLNSFRKGEVKKTGMEPVKFYTSDDCVHCGKAKKMLDQMGIPFEEVDVTGNDTEYTPLPQISFPNGKVLSGLQPRKWRKELRRYRAGV